MAKQHKAWRAVELADVDRLTAGLVHHRWPCWSPDGKWLAFAAENAWVLADRRGRVARVLEGPPDGRASFGPDGAFAFGRRGEIWMTPGGGAPAVRLLGGDGGRYRDPAWSPDGKLLVFAHAPDGGARTHLHSLEIATGARQALTNEAARIDVRPAFSPDGTLLFFEGAAGADLALYALELATQQLTRATPEGASFRCPAPLSSEFLAAVRQEGQAAPRLVLLEWRRSRARRLIEGEGEEREPAACTTSKGKVRLAWSSLPPPDGKVRRSDISIARVHGVESGVAPEPITIGELEISPALERALEAAR